MMIEDIPNKITASPETEPSRTVRSFWSRLSGRRLSAIEIAEGALLADVGVVFQILIWFLPFGGSVLQLLVPVIFAVLVLRQGLYVACMSLGVALFLITIVMGPHGFWLLLLEVGAGIFLGGTMRSGWSHRRIIAVGVLCGGLGLMVTLLGSTLLYGGPALLVRTVRLAYEQAIPVLSAIFDLLFLGTFWHSVLFPLSGQLLQWGLTYWPFLIYLFCNLASIPVVICVYVLTNFFVRLFGYQVRPFRLSRGSGFTQRLAFRLYGALPADVAARFPALAAWRREMRRLNLARLRQRRLEREGRRHV